MQQQCHKCGYVSDRQTRFCRQCGTQLFIENDATSAATRQYVPQQSATSYDAPYQSQLAQAQASPDSRFDYQTPDTSRLYNSQMAQNNPGYPSNYQPVEAKKSSVWKWVLIGVFCFILVIVGGGAMVISAIRAKHAAAERDAKQAAREAEEAGGIPPIPIPPIPPQPPSTSATGLDRYKYPNAKVTGTFGMMGNNVLTMSTNDSVSEVRSYYKKHFGDPMIENDDGDSVIFQFQGTPTIVITINEDKGDPGKTEITLVGTDLLRRR